MLYKTPLPPYQPVILKQWQQQMRSRIKAWYNDILVSRHLSNVDRGFLKASKLTYHTALFYLYRPSFNCLSPSRTQLLSITQATTQLIRLYRRFFLELKLTIYWHAVENLASAGTALMYAYSNSSNVRSSMSSHTLKVEVHTCSSVLWGMVERFPAFKGKQDAFNATAKTMLSGLNCQTSTYTSQPTGGWRPEVHGNLAAISENKHRSLLFKNSQSLEFDPTATGEADLRQGYNDTITSNVGPSSDVFPQDLSNLNFNDLSMV